MSSGHPSGETSRFVSRVLIVVAVVAVAFLAWQLRSVLLILFGSVVIATNCACAGSSGF